MYKTHFLPYTPILTQFKFTCVTIILLLFSLSLAAQSKVDSILYIANQIQSNTDRLKWMDSVAVKFIRTGDRNMGPLFEKRLDLAEQFGDFEENIERAIDGSDYYLFIQDNKNASYIIAPYLAQINKVEDVEVKRNLLDMQAAIYSEANEFGPAIELYERIIQLVDETKEPPIQQNVSTYRNLGKNLYGAGRYSESSIVLNQARDIALERNDSFELNYIYLELGNLFGRIGLWDESIKYFEDRHQFFSTPSPIAKLIDCSNFGNVHLANRRYEEGMVYFREGLKNKPYPPAWEMLELFYLSGMVESQYFLNQPDSVRYFYQQSLQAFESIDRTKVYEYLYQQALFFYQLVQKNYNEAEQILNTLFKQSSQNSNDIELQKYSLYYSELYQLWGKYQQALNYAMTYNEINDSIQTANKNNALLLYQTQYETKEKENMISTLRTEQALQQLQARATRNRFLGIGLLGLLTAGLLFMRQFYRNRVERAVQIERLRNKISSDLHDDVGSILTGLAMQSEILQSQLQGNDNSASSRIERITGMSRSAMSRMRDAVWAMDARKDSWNSLVDRMTEFATETLTEKDVLFEIRKKGINGEHKLTGEVRQNLYLIFKEAITNIVKHSDATQVSVDLINQGQAFEMIIKDNGSPVKKDYKTTGLGTSNMAMRADQLGGQLTTQYKEGFVVWLRCPGSF